jgi:hypothetical protein
MVLILSPAALASATWIVGATRKLDRSNSRLLAKRLPTPARLGR